MRIVLTPFMRARTTCGLVLTLAIVIWASCVHAQRNLALQRPTTEKRVALVIGNAAYQQGTLKNPANDAIDMAATLEALGFKVILRTNVSRRPMLEAVREFGSQIGGGGIGFFYFAGHGVQSEGRNFLIPLGAEVSSEGALEFEAVDAGIVAATMARAGSRINILVLDACRDNPFSRGSRSLSRGLVPMEVGKGTFLAYATSPGAVAADGKGRNGVYTRHLLSALREPDGRIEEVFKRVRLAVARETEGKQIPWDSSSLLGDFYFSSSPAPAVAAAVVDPGEDERALWDAVKDSRSAEELLVYLKRFPTGLFADLARVRMAALSPASPSAPVLRPQPLETPGTMTAHQQAQLGILLATGAGGKVRNDVEAVRLFRLSAGQRNALGQAYLGTMYAKGRGGLPRDEREALRLYQLSASQGNAFGQAQLGRMFALGAGGVPRDDVQAVELLISSAAQGNPVGQVELGRMYAEGRVGGIRDYREAVRLFRLSAAQDDSLAQAQLGKMHAEGRGGLRRDDNEAVRLYRLSAEKGEPAGQFSLGEMYESGRGVDARDLDTAARWYRQAADQGHQDATVALRRVLARE